MKSIYGSESYNNDEDRQVNVPFIDYNLEPNDEKRRLRPRLESMFSKGYLAR